MGFFEIYRRKRELKEILRLHTMILNSDDDAIKREIKMQMAFCEALTWGDYKSSCRKY